MQGQWSKYVPMMPPAKLPWYQQATQGIQAWLANNPQVGAGVSAAAPYAGPVLGAMGGAGAAAGSNMMAQRAGVPWTPNMGMTAMGPGGTALGWVNALMQQKGRERMLGGQGPGQAPEMPGASPASYSNYGAGMEPNDYADQLAALEVEIEQATEQLDEIMGGGSMSATKRRRRGSRMNGPDQMTKSRQRQWEEGEGSFR